MERRWRAYMLLIYLPCFLFQGDAFEDSSNAAELQDRRTLKLGEEKRGEKLPLAMAGSAIYEIEGLDPSKSYEIKISYPASIPASFSFTLLKHKPHFNRRLLNVDKLIFSARDNIVEEAGSRKVYVLVRVKPAGVVTKRSFKEQQFVIYNILCERVYLGGIPEQAWWIALLATAAILTSFLLAKHMPQSLPAGTKRAER